MIQLTREREFLNDSLYYAEISSAITISYIRGRYTTKTMSALTERKKREIESQYQEMIAKRARKYFLTVFCNVKNPMILRMVMDSIKKMGGIESISYNNGTNVITVVAQWKGSGAGIRIRKIRRIPHVMKVKAEVLAPLF